MTDTPQQPTPGPEQAAQAAPQPAPAPQPAKPDLTMAWLPHLLMIFTWWLGPLILWLIKKDQDKLAAFHSKQAMVWGIVPTALCVVVTIIGWIPFVGWVLVCLWPLLLLGNLVYGLVATVQAAQGKPFKYCFVADKFCAAEYAAAYPAAAPAAAETPQQPPAGT